MYSFYIILHIFPRLFVGQVGACAWLGNILRNACRAVPDLRVWLGVVCASTWPDFALWCCPFLDVSELEVRVRGWVGVVFFLSFVFSARSVSS